ncbi:MAG: hypothetical protein IK147_00945 [Clostridia bacterium]|nr:hypothetical protein [Clostridia bacterium]
MAGKILTPLALWKDFRVEHTPTFEIIEEKKAKGVLVSEIYIHGRKTESGQVKIHCVWARKAKTDVSPAVIVVSDLKMGADRNFAVKLASAGYVALSVDLGGKISGDDLKKPRYTVYPEDVEYANFNAAEESKTKIKGEVTGTRWYERGVALRYAIAFLRGQKIVSDIGAVGVFGGCNYLWYAAAAEDLTCAVFVGNAGWQGYRGICKFDDTPEPQFSDSALKFLAGIDAQAYATHVKCPTLILSPTNSYEYDMDRASDTVSRINDKLYSALDYSVGGRNEADFYCFNGCMNFLEEFLIKKGDGSSLPKTPTVKCAVKDGRIVLEVTADGRNLKTVSAFVAEEEVRPCLRAWEKMGDAGGGKDGVYSFSYTPYCKSGKAFVFARALYENGSAVSSVVLCRNFTDTETESNGKERVLFSSQLSEDATAFYQAEEGRGEIFGLRSEKGKDVSVGSGPMEMHGLCARYGTLTFKINERKYKPADGSMFMFDVCVRSGENFCVKLVTDYFGEKTEYVAAVKIFGGDIWQNVKLELNNFKTKDGMGIKSYDKIQAVEFSADGEFLVNNFLWV